MPAMIQNDFLNPLFSMNPFIVAIIIWFTGWGSLFLIARKTNSITTNLLKHPGFMIGDFLLLPLAGFLITYFYQSVSNPTDSVMSVKFTYFALIFGFVYVVASTLGSIFVTNNLHGIWSIPHGIFIWLMAYILSGFISRGFFQLIHVNNTTLWIIWIAVLFIGIVHVSFPLIFGPKTFPRI